MWADGEGLFQHTAARRRLPPARRGPVFDSHVSTHSRPKAAACMVFSLPRPDIVSTHSRPKAAARTRPAAARAQATFQHTAARRRLRIIRVARLGRIHVSTHSRPKAAACTQPQLLDRGAVSTHSRPKAAAKGSAHRNGVRPGFNTQPPEGGCSRFRRPRPGPQCFNTQPPEGGCGSTFHSRAVAGMFQHTAARRRLRGLSPAHQ